MRVKQNIIMVIDSHKRFHQSDTPITLGNNRIKRVKVITKSLELFCIKILTILYRLSNFSTTKCRNSLASDCNWLWWHLRFL